VTPDLFGPTVVTPPRAGEYQTIYADPAWPERGGGKVKRGADRHYALMSVDAILALPVREWAAPDCHLYLWVTNNYFEDGFRVMRCWGFRPIAPVTWFKSKGDEDADPDEADRDLQMGIGQYFRGVTESCLFGVRGNLPYRTQNGKRAQGRTGFHAPRTAHSVKPDKMRRMIELVSHEPRLEMFARRPAAGWDVWGHEAPV